MLVAEHQREGERDQRALPTNDRTRLEAADDGVVVEHEVVDADRLAWIRLEQRGVRPHRQVIYGALRGAHGGADEHDVALQQRGRHRRVPRAARVVEAVGREPLLR